MAEYIHQELKQEITAIGGEYILDKEVHLPFQEHELLYFLGRAVFDSTCCGISGCAYALVPGFILEWQSKKNGLGLPVSLVEPIHSQTQKSEIRRMILDEELVHQVQFL